MIRYSRGYKYQLEDDYQETVAVQPDHILITPWVSLGTNGLLLIRKGYAWDGPSGPAIDTRSFMRGSLVHDALYQLMRLGRLDRHRWRKEADRELRRICREDGMNAARAAWVYAGVRMAAGKATLPSHERRILLAP